MNFPYLRRGLAILGLAILGLLFYTLGAFRPAFVATFPEKVRNECSASWHVPEFGGNRFLGVTVNVLVDLKNSKNEVEERAFIYMECKGKVGVYEVGKIPKVIGTACSGVRMTGLKRSSLSSAWVFPIYPDDIEVISKPGQQPVVLKWQERSTFTIDSGKSFQWKMKSALTERTHSGTTTCQ